MKKKNTALRLAVQMVTFVITLTILIQGAQYMTSVLKFMGLRDSMEYMEECAYNYKWTDKIHEEYESVRVEIEKNTDPIVRMCYTHNTDENRNGRNWLCNDLFCICSYYPYQMGY